MNMRRVGVGVSSATTGRCAPSNPSLPGLGEERGAITPAASARAHAELLATGGAAVPDLHRKAGGRAAAVLVQAAPAVLVLEEEGAGLDVGRDGPGLVRASVAVPDVESGAVGRLPARVVDALVRVGRHRETPAPVAV